ncbi:MAG: geranylgeranylglyceryl/heptaprenylglyceryl phosphate synthase [Candidatus Bathyarchaeota archaeon]|nr:geranylgeranylglyceryl/heptaprenylglyceryl phosphate synthase [Candidatus Bathyarchaeota archaeon]
MIGAVERYILKRIKEEGAIHLTLIDPEKATAPYASRVAKKAEKCKTTAIMVGGSTSTSTSHLNSVVKAIKHAVGIPIILFPNNVTGISKYADAIWFMSLLNSLDPYFLTGAQVLGAPLVKKHGLEALPLGYIIVGKGGAAGIVGRAVPIPFTKPEVAAAHALAAQYFGMRFAYLEAGSGASLPVPPTMIRMVKHSINIPLIVGGGIRNSKQAKTVVAAGADIVVTGNVIEETGTAGEFQKLVTTVREN